MSLDIGDIIRPPGGRIEVFRTPVSLKTSYTNRLLCVKTCSKHLRSCSNSKVDPSSAHTQVRISHTHASTTNAHVRRPLSAQRSKRTTCRTSACVSRSERIRTAKDHAKRPSGLQAVASDVHGSARHINHHSPTEQRSPGTAAPGSTRSPSSSAFLTTHTATTHRLSSSANSSRDSLACYTQLTKTHAMQHLLDAFWLCRRVLQVADDLAAELVDVRRGFACNFPCQTCAFAPHPASEAFLGSSDMRLV